MDDDVDNQVDINVDHAVVSHVDIHGDDCVVYDVMDGDVVDDDNGYDVDDDVYDDDDGVNG